VEIDVSEPTIPDRIKAELRALIDSGELSEGEFIPSETQLVEQFGVGRGQVRQALRDLEVEGYILRSQGRRTTVAPPLKRAGSLPHAQSKTLAFLFPLYESAHAKAILDGYMSAAAREGYHATAYYRSLGAEEEADFIRKVRASGVEGLALWFQTDGPELREVINELVRARFPMTLIDRYLHDIPTDAVVTDGVDAGYRLTKALVERGHERIAILDDPPDVTSTRERYRGYRKALSESGLPYRREYYVRVEPTIPDASGVRNAMALKDEPTAFFSCYGHLAYLAVEELRALGYELPQDIELASVDEEGYADAIACPVITARQRSYEIGRQAAQVILERIADPQRAVDQRFIAPEYVMDGSMNLEATEGGAGTPSVLGGR
jgi:DNA-binding LacI/PurR family transcriptional regulator